MAEATFYTVNGPRNVYYAVRNHASGKVWTERTEHAALDQARDERLTIVASETIDHARLLDLMVRQSSTAQAEKPAGANEPARPSLRVESGLTRLLRRFRRDDKPAESGHHSSP